MTIENLDPNPMGGILQSKDVAAQNSIDELYRMVGDSMAKINETVAFINALQTVPAGTMAPYGGSAAPTGWLACDGSAVSRTTYASLFTAIGTTFGVGDGSTTFNLPNTTRRTIVGSGGSGTGTLGNAVGNTGGAETHTLVESEIPAHTHVVSLGDGVTPGETRATRVTNSTQSGTRTTTSAGGDGAHNNIQPSLVALYIIKT